MRTEVGAVGIHDFAGDCRYVRNGERIDKAQIGLRQADLQGVAVDDLEAGQRRVVIEASCLRGRGDRLRAAGNFAFDQPDPWALHGRVEQALDRVRVIGGGELAGLALERRVGSEVNAFANAADIGHSAILNHRHRFQRARHDLHRSREIIVVEHRLVDICDNAVGGGVRGELRVEAGLGDAEHDAQCLAGVRGVASGRRERKREREDEPRPKEASLSLLRSPHWSYVLAATASGRSTSARGYRYNRGIHALHTRSDSVNAAAGARQGHGNETSNRRQSACCRLR